MSAAVENHVPVVLGLGAAAGGKHQTRRQQYQAQRARWSAAMIRHSRDGSTPQDCPSHFLRDPAVWSWLAASHTFSCSSPENRRLPNSRIFASGTLWSGV